MAILKISILLFLSTSCSKLSYVVDQGLGQLALQNRAKDNSILLESPDLRPQHKEKIKAIEEYRAFFFNYFNLPAHPIYSKTTMLDNPEVTTLVISSPANEIKALEECFWIAGCFPYLGFFDQAKAYEFSKQQQSKGLQTYVRPVYAYSTLGYFQDPILSSFFYFSEFDLAELVFHELFHTLFFVKNETSFNENLAQFMGEEMVNIYFTSKSSDLKTWRKEKEKRNRWAQAIHQKALELQAKYQIANTSPAEILDNFLAQEFSNARAHGCKSGHFPASVCQEDLKNWNNARFSSYLTYYDRRHDFEKIYALKKSSLLDFYHFIQERYEQYENHGIDTSFEEYFFKDPSHVANHLSH